MSRLRARGRLLRERVELEPVTAEVAEGTGIGLSVSRRVVEAHGGRIWVEPAQGGGNAFRFTLPR